MGDGQGVITTAPLETVEASGQHAALLVDLLIEGRGRRRREEGRGERV